MFKLVGKEELTPDVKRFVVHAPLIAKKAKAGHFVIVRVDEKAERIPLTLVDWNPTEGTITLIFKEVGVSTKKLGALNIGDYIQDVVGPLGNPAEVKRYGEVAVIGGGVGVADTYPRARVLKGVGNKIVSIIGGKTASQLILEEEIKSVSDELHISTDDGSKGRKGFAPDILRDLLKRARHFDLVCAVGPVPMMKAVVKITRPYQIKTLVSLNPIMVDGSGMCGACRVSIGEETKFACVDGPEFDGYKVNFDELMARRRMYLEEEKLALQLYSRGMKTDARKTTDA